MLGFELKSSQNLNAAELLLQNSHYNSSIHCSYYACVQYMFHKIFAEMGMDKKQFDQTRSKLGSGSHQHMASIVKTKLSQQNRHSEFKVFQSNFGDFKKLREKADYGVELITNEEGKLAREKSLKIIEAVSTLKK